MISRRSRVAVTGLGAVTALGQDVTQSFGRLASGERAFTEISEFDASPCKIRLAAEIKNFRISDVAPVGKASLFSRTDALAVAAAEQAVSQAGAQGLESFLAVGTTGGGLREAEPVLMDDCGLDAALTRHLIAYPLFSPARRIADTLKTVRHTATFCSACSSSATAIAQAACWVASGRCERALAGGSDALSLLTLTGFASLGAMATEPCRPFDRSRNGMSLGEGAALLMLESEASARKRGVQVLAWLDGWSLGAEAHHITHPEPSGTAAAKLIVSAIRHAGLQIEDIGYFNAHGTGTIPNDSMEASAVRMAFGDFSARVFVSSAKGQLGHTLGAAGAIEAAITILAMREGRLPPTMGLSVTGADTALNHITGEAIRADCRHAVSSSFGFGGLGAVLAFSHVDTPNRIPSSHARQLVITSLSDSLPVDDPLSELDPDRSRRFDRVTALTCAGARQAIAEEADCGLVVSNAYGNVARLRGYLTRLREKGIRGIAPAEFPHLVPSAIAGNASIYLGLTGPVTTVSDETRSYEAALDFACSVVQSGLARSMIAGVAESRDAGTTVVSDPFGAISSSAATTRDASTWVRIETEGSSRQRGSAPLAKIVATLDGAGALVSVFRRNRSPRAARRAHIVVRWRQRGSHLHACRKLDAGFRPNAATFDGFGPLPPDGQQRRWPPPFH